jgi:hypothetical protein
MRASDDMAGLRRLIAVSKIKLFVKRQVKH